MSDWDVAIRFHELKRTGRSKLEIAALRNISAQAVMRRAQQLMGAVSRPRIHRTDALDTLSPEALQPELDLERTLEESPNGKIKSAADLWMSYESKVKVPLVLVIDTSLSMTGEKIALTAVALAVVLIQFNEDPVGVVAFENQAQTLKSPFETITLSQLIERFLDVPALGYTHLEDGLIAGQRMVKSLQSRHRHVSTILISDGKYTAGRDPSYLASRFQHLTVLKMGTDRSSEALCRELSIKGGGRFYEVADYSDLPSQMVQIVRSLINSESRRTG